MCISWQRRWTRRQLLGRAAQLGIGATVVSLGDLHQGRRVALAEGGAAELVEVLVADVTDTGAAGLGRGQASSVDVVSNESHTEVRSSGGGEFVSRKLELPFAATHLGLHWTMRASAAAALRVGVRVLGDDGAWSDWHDVSIEAVAGSGDDGLPVDLATPVHGHGHDLASDATAARRVFASLVSGDRGREAQYRVRFPENEPASFGSMTVTAINSVDGPRSPMLAAGRTVQSFTTPDGATINVVTREGWGCNEAYRVNRKGTEIWPEMYVPVKKAMLHHTATSNSYVDGAAEVRAIYAYHARTLGWGDIGYHALVDRFGNVYEGRHGRGEDAATREILSDDVVGGHVSAFNYGSTGVAAIGNFDEVEPSVELLAAIEDVLTFELGRQYLDPLGESSFLRSDGIWKDAMPNLTGHRDATATACPGAYLYPHLSSLRSSVAGRLNGVGSGTVPTLFETTGAARDLIEPANLAFSWSASNAEYFSTLEGWCKAPNAEPITYRTGYQAAGFNDPRAMQQNWIGPASETSAQFSGLAAGQYTMHVRTNGGRVVATQTYNVKSTRRRK
jgi:hypothetical protein